MKHGLILFKMAKTVLPGLLMACCTAFCVVTASTISIAQDSKPESPLSTPGEEKTETKQPIMVVPTVSDNEIANRLERILESTGWFDTLRISVREGIVFLDGTTIYS